MAKVLSLHDQVIQEISNRNKKDSTDHFVINGWDINVIQYTGISRIGFCYLNYDGAKIIATKGNNQKELKISRHEEVRSRVKELYEFTI